MRYAIIKDNVVIDIVYYDGQEDFYYYKNFDALLQDYNNYYQVGMVYVNGMWIRKVK